MRGRKLAKMIFLFRFCRLVHFISVVSNSSWPHGLQHAPVHHQLPELAQTHVHQVTDATQPSHPLLSSFPPAFNLSQHQGLFKWVSSSHQVARVLEFQFQHQSFQWTPGLIPLGLTGLISLQSGDFQESSPTPQFKSINSSALSFLHSLALTPQLWLDGPLSAV